MQQGGGCSTDTFDLESLKARLRREGAIPESDKGHPEAAVAIIINPKDRRGSILLIKRTERVGDPWSGQIAFPGGHKASSDRNFLETAIREAHEEVGIDLREHELLGQLPLVYARTRQVQVAPFIFQLKTSVILKSNEEVAEKFWVPLSILDVSEVERTEVKVEEGKLSVDGYIYGGNTVWGLTFRIINILLDRKETSTL
ncbi:MAG: CoA pyrophosphatase [Candidatus Bathyarchaeia archaeon]|jgi:8-oxo-dGTP pyrophosphatase MutT (NUDIX family)